VPGWAALIVFFEEQAHLRSLGFIVEHTLKLAAFYVALHGVFFIIVGLARRAGQPARLVFDNVFAARTPADFWRRYNRPVGQFLYEDIFKPSGGRRHPVWATLVTFVFSAIGHEYLISISIGRVEGYQTAFFLIQGLAVALTLRVRPKGAVVPVAVALTLAFNLATSFLFFASIQHYFPFWLVPPK
jgi:D-alanyl-lipoteichoic acid acyltransferase DltB (MBOAT superfamily)